MFRIFCITTMFILSIVSCTRFLTPEVTEKRIKSLKDSIYKEHQLLKEVFVKLDTEGNLALCVPVKFQMIRFLIFQIASMKDEENENLIIDLINKSLRRIKIAKQELYRKNCVDRDGDGLMDIDEEKKFFTDPKKADTDGDGLSDKDEIKKFRTNPVLRDTDKDFLNDGYEVILRLDPTNRDTDLDGYSDGLEVKSGSDPLNECSQPLETKRFKGPWAKCNGTVTKHKISR
ncbi:MAG: hypothetical protein VX794_03610 [Nitrospinota bacterium]|nr:hypothetical protein [Nitrospinota bacterium]